MKHVKLFETFAQSGNDNVVFGVLSEGVDVALFPMDKAMEINKHLKSNTEWADDYYFPFMIPLGATPHLRDRKYLLVDVDGLVAAGEKDLGGESDYPSADAGGTKVYVVDDYGISLLEGNELGITVYYADGSVDTPVHGGNTYAAELVGGNKYMEVQSWGQGLKSGAFEHFMSLDK